jgi:ABC-2 type transport system ATP-binding protein
LLCAKGVAFSYRKPQQQLAEVSFTVAAGEVLGLLGPNGAGKTTLAGLITGHLTPTAGSLTFNQQPVYLGHPDIALVPQEFAFYPRLSVRENLAYFAGMLGLPAPQTKARIASALERCQLDELQHRRAERLSGGFKRRLNVAIALLQAPQLLILDEPTANVDPHSRAFLLNTLRQLNAEGVAIIYTSHLLSEVEALAHKVMVINAGRVQLQGTLAELLNAQQATATVTLTPTPTPEQALPLGLRALNHGWWELPLNAREPSLSAALGRLEAAGFEPQQVRFGQRPLEEVYLKCIGGIEEPA